MDKEKLKVQGEKYAIKRDKVAEEVKTVRYSLKKLLELTREIFEADSCYLYLVNTEMDDDEKSEIIRKRVEHIKNIYEKRKEIYPNELEIAQENPNRAIILNFIDVSEKEDEKIWKIDSNNKPEKYVVFDKCIAAGPIGDGLKATVEADKVYFDAVDSMASDESISEINISIFEEGLNAYIARTKKIVIFSSDKAISRHNSSANYNVKKGIIRRCEMMIGFPLIDEDKSVIGILKVEKYIINYDMGEYNYKFEKTKIDKRVEDVKNYLPMFVRLIKSSKEDLYVNSYEELFRGMELLEDLKSIKPIILKDILIRLLKSLDDFFRTNSCEKLCTTMGLLGDLDKVDEGLLKSIDVIEFNLLEGLQDIEWNSQGNLTAAEDPKDISQNFECLLNGLKSLNDGNDTKSKNAEKIKKDKKNKCPEEINKEIRRILEYLKRIENYERINNKIPSLLGNEKDDEIKKLLEELNNKELNYLKKIGTSLAETKIKILCSKKIYNYMGILNQLDRSKAEVIKILNIVKILEENPSKNEIYSDLLNKLKCLEKTKNELKSTQRRVKHSIEKFKDATALLKSLHENLNDAVTYLNRFKYNLEDTQKKVKDSNKIFNDINQLFKDLTKLEWIESIGKRILHSLKTFKSIKQSSGGSLKSELDELFSKEIDTLIKKIDERQDSPFIPRTFDPHLINEELDKLLENLDKISNNFTEIKLNLSYTEKWVKNLIEICEEVIILLEDLTELEFIEIFVQNPSEKQQEIDVYQLSCKDFNFGKQSCKNIINLKEILKIKSEYLDNLISILKESPKIVTDSQKISTDLENLELIDYKLDNIREYVQRLHDEKEVKRFNDDKKRSPKNPITVKWNELFNEDIYHLLENIKRIECHKTTSNKIIKQSKDPQKTIKDFNYSEEVHNYFRDFINSEIDKLLKYLKKTRPIILENIKNINDEVKINKNICDVNSSTKIERNKCPEQINKEIYDITLDLFYELKRKEYIGYDEILNSISEYMSNISKLLNLNADMTRSFKEFLEGVRKHEELLLFGLNDYRDHFVHQFHVFISGYIIINEFGIDSLMKIIKKNKEYILGKKEFSHEISKSDVLRMWFVAASYHDYAYIFEKIEEELNSFFKDVLGYSFTVKFNWEQLLTRNTKFPDYLNQFINLFDSEKGTKQDIVNRQNILRRNYLDSIIINHDHGVLSALLLADYTKDLNEKRFYEYMCAALAISLHNKSVFKDLTEQNQVLFESFPIAFLLAYCDTAQTFGRLEGKEHVESSQFPIKFSGIKVEKNKNYLESKVKIVYKLEYLCEQLNQIPTAGQINIWAKNVNNVFGSEKHHFEIQYCRKGGKEVIHTLLFGNVTEVLQNHKS
jgi:hypothetical protein